jgi:hypothetical protein
MDSHSSHDTDSLLDGLVRSAVAAGAPAPVAEEARRITAARFPRIAGRATAHPARAEAYFWGIVRRRALTGGAPVIARLIVASSLASELRAAGHAPEAIARALT